MGAGADDTRADDIERPQQAIRFDRGFAMSITEVTVGDYRRFLNATGRETRAQRRGYSMAYDERSGNCARVSGVDWRRDYAGAPAGAALPGLPLSARDAEAYAQSLTAPPRQRHRLPPRPDFASVPTAPPPPR